MSGLARPAPGIARWSLKRSPLLCSADLNANSAGVSACLVACIRRLTASDDAGGLSLRTILGQHRTQIRVLHQPQGRQFLQALLVVAQRLETLDPA